MTLFALSLIAFLIACVLVLGWLKKRRDAQVAAELSALERAYERPDGIDEDWEKHEFGEEGRH